MNDRGVTSLSLLKTPAHEVAQEVPVEVWSTARRAHLVSGRRVAVPGDQAMEGIEARIDQHRVRRGPAGLTDIRRLSVTPAHYGGYTCPQVAKPVNAPADTIGTCGHDGSTRLRDSVSAGR